MCIHFTIDVFLRSCVTVAPVYNSPIYHALSFQSLNLPSIKTLSLLPFLIKSLRILSSRPPPPLA